MIFRRRAGVPPAPAQICRHGGALGRRGARRDSIPPPYRASLGHDRAIVPGLILIVDLLNCAADRQVDPPGGLPCSVPCYACYAPVLPCYAPVILLLRPLFFACYLPCSVAALSRQDIVSEGYFLILSDIEYYVGQEQERTGRLSRRWTIAATGHRLVAAIIPVADRAHRGIVEAGLAHAGVAVDEERPGTARARLSDAARHGDLLAMGEDRVRRAAAFAYVAAHARVLHGRDQRGRDIGAGEEFHPVDRLVRVVPDIGIERRQRRLAGQRLGR